MRTTSGTGGIIASAALATAISFPEAARDQLAAKGAKTTLATYEGGHGWHGDVFGEIRTGVQWLEANAAKGGK